ncbi:MAG: hypothetical protein R6X32_08105 [Chloroflexota bacterium]
MSLNHNGLLKIVLCLLFSSILLIGTACTSASSQPETVTPSAYPVELDEPASEARARLGEQQWLLSAVTYRGEEQEISALESTYFQFIFTPDRNTLLFTTPCEGTDDGSKGFGYTILFHEEQQYSLHPQDGIDVGCGEMIDAQTDYLMGAFLETSRYELRNDQLLLTGDNNQIVLERVNTTP